MSTVMLIETFFTTIVLLSVILGTQVLTSDIVKKETVDVKVTRTENAALSLTSVPNGYIEVPMEGGYEFKWNDPNIYLKYQGEEEAKTLDLLENGYENVDGPEEYEEVERKLCLRKTGKNLNFETGPCGD